MGKSYDKIMFESLSHRKKDLYDEPSPLNGLNPYSRMGRQVDGGKSTQSLDSTLSEHGLKRARSDHNSQNLFQAFALALGFSSHEESNVLSRIRDELLHFMNLSPQKLPLRLQELRNRKDSFSKILDNPGLEEHHKVH